MPSNWPHRQRSVMNCLPINVEPQKFGELRAVGCAMSWFLLDTFGMDLTLSTDDNRKKLYRLQSATSWRKHLIVWKQNDIVRMGVKRMGVYKTTGTGTSLEFGINILWDQLHCRRNYVEPWVLWLHDYCTLWLFGKTIRTFRRLNHITIVWHGMDVKQR